MGDWYEGLKKPENALGQNRQNRQNPPGYSFVGSVSPSSERLAKSRDTAGEVLSVLSVQPEGEFENSQEVAPAGEGGFVGSVSARPERIEEISSSPAGHHLIAGPVLHGRSPAEKPENAPGQNRQNPQNRTGVGFEGFVGSSPERITHFSRLTGWDAEDWQAAFDERAAVLEYDAGLRRADAERIARAEVFKPGGRAS
ncbi:hypothetical protein [Xanthobacter autotrophicus]|uniref:hypothetical protein n=1 Tax=Xanthobacter autotrophicus TaxID=280 RepID=UPI003728534B